MIHFLFPFLLSVLCDSEARAVLGAKRLIRIISKIGCPIAFKNYECMRIVAESNLGFSIRPENLLWENIAFCSYEPEVFPGLVSYNTLPEVATHK